MAPAFALGLGDALRTARSPDRWTITEDVPEYLGIALAVREVRRISQELELPTFSEVQPESEARDERTWHQWWSYLVTSRIPGSTVDISGATVKKLAGEVWPEAKNLFAARKLETAGALAGSRISTMDAWRRTLADNSPSGRLAIDVVPGDFRLVHRVVPRYWLLSLRSRLDNAAVEQLLSEEFPPA